MHFFDKMNGKLTESIKIAMISSIKMLDQCLKSKHRLSKNVSQINKKQKKTKCQNAMMWINDFLAIEHMKG